MKFKHELVELFQLKTVTGNGKRFYETPEGDRYPSVTTITGLLSREAIQAWRLRVGEEAANKITKAATTRGTKVHKLAELYLRNELVSTSRLFEAERPPHGESFKQLVKRILTWLSRTAQRIIIAVVSYLGRVVVIAPQYTVAI